MIRRVALSILVLALAGGFASVAADAATWSDVWLTREQQGQRLMDANQPAAAANLFRDPRRQAYAQLQAGQYAKAAKLLKPFKDADSQYNRGNALAHTGQLREALKAYDAALTASPGNRDVMRNRDLVRRALEQQQQKSQQQAGGNGQSGGGKGEPKSASGKSGAQPDRSGDKQNSPGSGSQQEQSANASGNRDQNRSGQSAQGNQNQSQSGQSGQSAQAGNQSQSQQAQSQQGQSQQGQSQQGQSQQGQSQQGQSQQGQSQQGQSQQGQSQANANSSQAAPNQAQSANQAQASGQSQGGNQPSATAGQPQSAGQPGGSNSGQDARTAREDAEAGLRYQQSQQARAGSARSQTGPDSMGAVNPRAGTRQPDSTPPPPPTEQSLALDQWLRGIPEDSGELLQRKFLIEHMLRQRGNEQ